MSIASVILAYEGRWVELAEVGSTDAAEVSS